MIHEIKKGGTLQGQEAYANHRIIDGVSKVDIDGNNTLYIKAVAVTVSTCETRPFFHDTLFVRRERLLFPSIGIKAMSKYDELVRIFLKAKDEHESDRVICQNFAHNLMESIFEAFDCPSGIMVGDSRRDDKGFWNTSFLLMIVPNFPSSIAVKKSDRHFIVRFESDDTQFTIQDLESDNLESFYDFVFARWKEKLAHYFHAPLAVNANIEYGQYL